LPCYENVFVARQDMSMAYVKDLAALFQAIVEERGGEDRSL